MKFIKKLQLPHPDVFNALKRYVFVYESLYAQFITWDRQTWKPLPTPRAKLTFWFVTSTVVTILLFFFIFFSIRELIAYQKDPNISSTHVLLLALYICLQVLALAAVFTYILKVDEICFLIGNIETLTEFLEPKGMHLVIFWILNIPVWIEIIHQLF